MVKKIKQCIQSTFIKLKGLKEYFVEYMRREREKQGKYSWANFAQLLVGLATLSISFSFNFFIAEYQGRVVIYLITLVAIVVIVWLLIKELIGLAGYKFYQKLKNSISKKSILKKAIAWIKSRKRLSLVITVLFVCIVMCTYNYHKTEYYASVVEVYGIPTGVGDSLSFKERMNLEGYWKIKYYRFRDLIELTYMGSYGQLELMQEYSTAYRLALFKPSARIVYRCRTNKEKYRSYSENIYKDAKEYWFKEVEEVTYYSSSGKELMRMEINDHGIYKIRAYSSVDMPQLLNSTLLKAPPDGEVAQSNFLSKQIEIIYNAEGLPEICRLKSGINNLYGVNGEYYEYDQDKRVTALYYIDSNGNYVCNNMGIMMITFQYDEGGNLEDIRYFADGEGLKRTEGFNGAYHEKFVYDHGNLAERRQYDRYNQQCNDLNGVYVYSYEYSKTMFSPMVLKGENYLNATEKSSIRDNAFHSYGLEFERNQVGWNKELIISFDKSNTAEKEEAAFETIEKPGQSNIQGQLLGILVLGQEALLGEGEEQKNIQTDEKEVEFYQNYQSICFTINRDKSISKISYYDRDGEPARNEEGYAVKQLQYDRKKRIINETYFDIDGHPCFISGGYAGVRTVYTTEEDGKIESVEYLDDKGELTFNKNLGYAYISYKHFEQGRGERVVEYYYDQNGKLVQLPEKGYSIKEEYYDASGLLIREVYYKKEDIAVYRSDYGVAEIIYDYEDDRSLNRIRYIDLQGKLAIRLDTGYAEIRLKSDPYGNVVKSEYFDAEGKSVVCKEGSYASYESTYENGKLMESRYYGSDGKLTLRSDTGYAIIKNEYDENGQQISQFYYGVNEEPIISTEYHCAGMEFAYDEKGNRTDTWYIGLDGELMVRNDLWYAMVHSEYDDYGNVIKRKYYDANGNPAIYKDGGYYFYEYAYENGKWMEGRYYGADEKLTLRSDAGYAVIRNQYDEYGRYVSQYFYGVNDEPIISTKYHCAGIEFAYDEKGNRTDTWYIGLDGELMVRSDLGYAQIHSEYDGFGNEIKVEFLDTDSNPAVQKEGSYASYESKYENGKWTESRYYDPDGKLTLRSDTGYAIIKNEYDEKGQWISQLYYGVDEEPVISTEYHCAGWGFAYDERGNRTDTWYIGLDGELMVRSDLGYAQIHSEYDGLGNEIKVEFLDTDGKLTLRSNTGYAIIKNEYDEKGQWISQLYYGVDEEPVISTEYHCAGWGFAYDEGGNRTDTWYIGLDGELMVRNDLGYAQVHSEYDVYGNVIKSTYFDANGNLAVLKEGGYASYESIYENGNWIENHYYDANGLLIS